VVEETTSRGIGRWIEVRPGEGRALVYAFGYFFFLLASYYILRPVRDEMAVRSGVGGLPSLFTATFIVSLIIAPLYAGLVSKLRRGLFIPLVYAFLILNIAAFWYMLTYDVALEWAARIFFVWLTVYSVLAVSIFWSFMSDLFDKEQATRLYPTIAAGGSLGGIAGSFTVSSMATTIGAANLLLIAGSFLAITVYFVVGLDKETTAQPAAEKGTGGGWLSGLSTVISDPYMRNIAIWVFLLSLAGTFAYFMQTQIVGDAGLTSNQRTEIFGRIDLFANTLIPLIQLLLTRLALKKLGIGLTLGIVALVFAGGFLALAASPMIAVLVAFQICQRTGQFALSNPARESLFTVVDRDRTYKAKNVIDNAVFRGGDVANSWLFNLLHGAAGQGLGLSLSKIALIGAPIAAGWFVLSLILGRQQARRAETEGDRP
jgi:AAA family ATP:ADP antiporter